MQLYLNQNLSKKDAMKKVAQDRGVPKREIYRKLLEE
jgi:16S rRNA (cytidine1402-2'-O)-methyltransferase